MNESDLELYMWYVHPLFQAQWIDSINKIAKL